VRAHDRPGRTDGDADQPGDRERERAPARSQGQSMPTEGRPDLSGDLRHSRHSGALYATSRLREIVYLTVGCGRLRPSGALAGMKRLRRTFVITLLAPVALAVTLGAAGCNLLGSDSPDPDPTGTASATGSADPSASPTVSGSATPTGSATPLVEFTTDGAGPYQLNKGLTELQANPGLEQVTPNSACPGNMTARGSGVWRDVVLHFRPDGRLYLLENRSQAIPTPSGAYLGTTLADLKTIYTGLVTQELTRGSTAAFFVQTLGGRGILFQLNANKQVDIMYAGDGTFLRSTFTVSGNFC
jgi:hypothetical protein